MPEDLVAMARAAKKDDRLADGALYGKLADEIERHRGMLLMLGSDVLQNDLRELLEAVGLPSRARPQTPHTVFQEALGVVRARQIALESIANYGHDCPAALDISEEEWQRRRATAMQRIARKALEWK